MKLSDAISIDDESNTITAFGQRVSGQFLEAITHPTPDGIWLRVIELDGVVIMETTNMTVMRECFTLQ